MKKVSEKLILSIATGIFLLSASTAVAVTPGGGLYVPPSPELRDAVCLSSCSALRTVAPGGTIQISGSNLSDVDIVSFKGKKGRIKSSAKANSDSSVVATVPEDAISGKVKVLTKSGSSSAASPESLTVDENIQLGRGAKLRLTDAETSPTTAYQFGARKPTLSFIASSGSPSNNLRIDIVGKDGELIRSFTRSGVPSGSTQTIAWNGKTNSGSVAASGDYRFVVRSIDGTKAQIASSVRKKKSKKKASKPFNFSLYAYKFPVLGSHSYGDGLGAGRGHQGQDLLANCGLKVVAARAGTVYYNDYQASGAGNYVVINTKGNGGKSNVYMHLIKPSTLKVGEKVKTGDAIGIVGSTGRSSACHLHFEIWSAPGWYQGGTVMDPTPPLKSWDRYS